MEFVKYPRTNHIEGSKFSCDPLDLKKINLHSVRGKHLVIEEKMDGTQIGIFFQSQHRPRIQSRGHFVDERFNPEFDLLKNWIATHRSSLWNVLRDRYILFGEWLYAKHTIYYDRLPDHFMEYDIFDRVLGTFLSTGRRRDMLKSLSFLSSVKVVGEGVFSNAYELYELTGPSSFISPKQNDNFLESVAQQKLNANVAIEQTDLTGLMEGLYIKHEAHGKVERRYKFIRGQFLAQILAQGVHWKNRPIIPNQLER
ncbi:RNA ligase [Oleiphilus messinensis]|uniref:RNA ligase n=1 Tax=Oleiphilus messinensis TaxID=141451 RepID=A0A1Y0I2W5_9GAMM|nr:RNA ligase family protein [Oleiphilus messinensis]ARU54126.1 RNA ligase [Oleiphilus messinensis]